MEIPRWLILQQQIDYYIWQLGEILKSEKNLSGIEKMIDEATGFDKKKMKEISKIINRIKKLMKEFKELK